MNFLFREDETVVDPVCGKEIRAPRYAGAMIRVDYKKYYFCTYECKKQFVKEWNKFLSSDNLTKSKT